MGDLLQTLQSNPFVQSLETILHGAPSTHAKQTGLVSQTAQNLGQTVQVPFQQAGHAIAPNVVPDVTQQQMNQAEQGAEFGMSPGGPADPANALYGSTLDTAATDINATIKAAKAGEGGLQRGSITPSEFINPKAPQPATQPLVDGSGNPIESNPLKVGIAPTGAAHASYATPGSSAYEPPPDLPPPPEGAGENFNNAQAKGTQYKQQAQQNRAEYANNNKMISTKSDITENTNRGLSLNDDIPTTGDKARINATMNKHGITGDFTRQKTLQEQKIANLSNDASGQIQSDYAKDPTTNSTSSTDLTNEIYANMKNNPSKYHIPSSQLSNEISKYVNNLYARATGNVGTTSESDIPDSIPDPIIYRMKQLAGQDSQTTFSQPDPTKWSSSQQVSRFGRDSMDDIIDAKHPEVAGINSDTADLIKANDPLMKKYNAEQEQLAKNRGKGNFFTNHPKGTIGAVTAIAGTVGAGLGIGIPALAGAISGATTNTKLTPDEQTITASPLIPAKMGLMDQNTYNQQKAQYQSVIDNNKLNDPNTANAAQGHLDSLNDKWAAQSQEFSAVSDYNKQYNQATVAANALKSAPATIFTNNAEFQKWYQSTSANYAGFATAMDALSQSAKVDLAKSGNASVLMKTINTILDSQMASVQAAQTSTNSTTKVNPVENVGATTPQVQAPVAAPQVNWQTQSPTTNAILQNGGSGGGKPLPFMAQLFPHR